MNMNVKGYWSTKQICQRFNCTRMTIHRWMKREKLPFPKPRFTASGSQNLWAIDDVQQWEMDCVIANNPDLATTEAA